MSRQSERDDGVERRREQWLTVLPDVDTTGMAILGRARRITAAVRPAIEAIFRNHGLDSGEFDVLASLLRSGPPFSLRPTELYRALMISSGGLTARLDRLARAGHISRSADPADARSLRVTLTDQGRAVAEQAFREDMALERRLLAGLSKKQRNELADLLRVLALSLGGDTD